jgi:hypothetical protein
LTPAPVMSSSTMLRACGSTQAEATFSSRPARVRLAPGAPTRVAGSPRCPS